MPLTRGQVLVELDRRGKLPAEFQNELATLRAKGDQQFLSSLPADRAALVQAIAEGRSKPPAANSRNMALLQDVATYKPGYNAADAAAQNAARVDLAKGELGKNIRSLNTAIGHLGSLSQDVDALGNVQVPLLTQPVNWLRNKAAVGSGSVDQRGFGVDRQAVADELETAFRGGRGGTLAGTKGWEGELNLNDAPGQQRAAVAHAVHLLQSRIDAIGDQYGQAMRTSADGISLLSPESQAAMRRFTSPGFVSGAGMPPGGSPPQSGPGGTTPNPFSGGPATQPGDQLSIATGATRSEHDRRAEALIEQLTRSGQNADQINAALAAIGVQGRSPITQQQVSGVQAYLKTHPNFTGFASSTRDVPTTLWNRFTASPLGVGALSALDGASGGLTDEAAGAVDALTSGKPLSQAVAEANAAKQGAFAAHPRAAFLGESAGTIGAMYGLGALGRATGFSSRFANPQLAGDLAFGAASGAGQSNDHRLLGAAVGAAGGAAGSLFGAGVGAAAGALARTAPGLAITNRVGGVLGTGLLTRVGKPSAADTTLFNALNRAGVDNVTGALGEASRLGVPMSLADTSPTLRELGGAVVRRSPEASSVAENAFLPRAQGQYDRFTGAVERNLGPTANIPQQSIDLTRQARAAAAPFYDKAYANSVPSSPELESLLATPFGRQALSRAHVIAANERRNPAELGFALDNDGNTVLNAQPNDLMVRHLDATAAVNDAQDAYRLARRTTGGDVQKAGDDLLAARDAQRQAAAALKGAPDPTTAASVPAYTQQTLDYVKRGMDDVLEEQRDKVTGRLNLDEAGRAQNDVRSRFVNELDRLNPDYAAARQAYAGPVQARDALQRGQDAYGLHPDQLGVQVGTQTPEQLAQMQLGYRGALVDHAGRVRDAGNPWDATLGSPVARQRLGTMYPGSDGVDALLRQQQLERRLAQSTNGVLGNSKTAQRQIADEAFTMSPAVEAAMHATTAVATGGHSLPLTAARVGLNYLKDSRQLGLGQQVAKADALAPSLFDTSPHAALARVNELIAQQQAWTAFKQGTTPSRPFGILGRGLGLQAAITPLNR